MGEELNEFEFKKYKNFVLLIYTNFNPICIEKVFHILANLIPFRSIHSKHGKTWYGNEIQWEENNSKVRANQTIQQFAQHSSSLFFAIYRGKNERNSLICRHE